MLRRRIFSSAMASVMALSSIAVVANAEETTAYVKTEADLEKLVNETYGDEYRAYVLPEYGTTSAEIVLDALEAADAILDDVDATDKDYTVAYAMVEATVAKLEKKTAADLQKLIDDWKRVYEQNNICNEELGDSVYTPDSYENFERAYENAMDYVNSDSPADITDAWLGLNGSYWNLSKLDSVSKADFRAVLKKYEDVKSHLADYEDWRIGKLADSANTSNYGVLGGTQKIATFGFVKSVYENVELVVEKAYVAIDEISQFNGKTTQEDIVNGYKAANDAVALFNAWTPDNVTKATKAGVQNLLDKYHGQLVYEFNPTSANNLMTAIVEAAGEDKIKVEVILDDNSADFVNYTDIATLAKDGTMWNTEMGWSDNYNWSSGMNKLIHASVTIKSDERLYIPVTKAGLWTGDDIVKSQKTPDVTDDMKANGESWKLISAKSAHEISQYVEIGDTITVADAETIAKNNSTMDILTATTTEYPINDNGYATKEFNPANSDSETYVDLADAYKLAVDYIGGVYDGIYAIDTTNSIKEASGRGTEWALVYRYLNYALADRYDAAAGGKYTKKDVQQLKDACYELMDKTGDASVFAITHNAVTDVRQEAIEWLRDANADRTYKDHQAGDNGRISSDQMYNKLWGCYDALNKEFNAMKYSFGDVYDLIADVYTKIDNGDLDPTSSLLTAVEKAAYNLSTLPDGFQLKGWSTWYYDNYAFTADRIFNRFNRIITTESEQIVKGISATEGVITGQYWPNTAHWALWKSYEDLIAAVEAQNVVTAKGDVDNDGTAYTVKDALAALKIANKLETLTVDVEVADHNDNDTVDVSDALAILKKANGLA